MIDEKIIKLILKIFLTKPLNNIKKVSCENISRKTAAKAVVYAVLQTYLKFIKLSNQGNCLQ